MLTAADIARRRTPGCRAVTMEAPAAVAGAGRIAEIRSALAALHAPYTACVWSDGSWSLHHLVLWAAESAGLGAEAWIATWSCGPKAAAAVNSALRTGLIDALTVVVARRYKTMADADRRNRIVWHPDANVYVAASHAKLAVVRSPAASFTIIGSGNLNENRTAEAYAVLTTTAAADFAQEQFGRIIREGEAWRADGRQTIGR